MAIDIKAEPFSRWCREAVERGLFEAHWQEVGRYKDKIALEPDFEKFSLLERMQLLPCFSARKGGELVGYAIYVCTPALHYKSHVCALCDAIYVVPEHRPSGAGPKMMQLARAELKGRGLSKIVYHFKREHDHPRLMAQLGCEPSETLYEDLLI